MKKNLFAIVFLIFTLNLTAQSLKQDAAVRTGKLKNGLTYYIRHNAKEAGLADFYIAQRVGSILEEPRQRGLAHFLEHMAFNGTKHFPGKGKQLGIVPWCETIGVKFGANLNAYTSVDQTVYNISAVPLKREGIVDSCLLILHDWSHYLLLEEEEIDKERGVIHEEWRTRRADRAVSRLMENAAPKIYKGTKYEDCLPIGSMDIVGHFACQDLRDYYQKWYRPDLQAVIVVGDIDVDKMERKIKKLFSSIPMPKNPAKREYYPVNDNDTMIVAIERDKEQPIVLAHFYQKRDATPDDEKNDEAYLRGDYIDGLIGTMLNDRLSELRLLARPPFQSSTAHASTFFLSRTKEAFSLSISCQEDNILGGFIAAIGVAEQARQHGFTTEELMRAKSLKLNHAERKYRERDDRRNSRLVDACVRHFLTAEPLLSADDQLELARRFDREVTLEEVNAAVRRLITDQNQVVVVYAPEKEGLVLPTEQQIESVILGTQQLKYAPYEGQKVETTLTSYLAPLTSKKGSIINEQDYKHDFKEYTLSNGLKVYARKTDYAKDAVTFSLRAAGGTSLYSDEDIPNFSLINSAVADAGVAEFDAMTLRRMLTGKSVRVQPSVGSRAQNISGGASVKDLETLFQLVHLYFTQPRRDTVAFQSLMNRMHAFLTNRNASPKVDYNDSIRAILYNHHPRLEPVVQKTLEKVSYDRILDIYRERFSNAANFQAVIIGNYDEQTLRNLMETYLATLPATNQHEDTNWQNIPRIVSGDFTHIFKKQMATPLANVSIYYTADVLFTPQSDLELDFLTRVLKIAYTDSVREEKGGTYGVSVVFELDKDDVPNTTLRISYNADPTRYEELNPIIYEQLENVAKYGPSESSMQKIKEYLSKQYQQSIITNDYWSYVIWHELDDNTDFDANYTRMVEQMTAEQVQQMARKILASHRRIEVTMLSE
ncbi:MAG: insulinase family protein [Prevotella sp.]|nr:insulinase family protein [Prevotella sp.]